MLAQQGGLRTVVVVVVDDEISLDVVVLSIVVELVVDTVPDGGTGHPSGL